MLFRSRAQPGPMRDLHGLEYVIVVPLIAAVLFLGLYPKPVLARIEPATTRTLLCVTTFEHGQRPVPFQPSVDAACRGSTP